MSPLKVVKQVESLIHLKSLDLVVVYTRCLLGIFYSLYLTEATYTDQNENVNIPCSSGEEQHI
jgi:hypothetical protein